MSYIASTSYLSEIDRELALLQRPARMQAFGWNEPRPAPARRPSQPDAQQSTPVVPPDPYDLRQQRDATRLRVREEQQRALDAVFAAANTAREQAEALDPADARRRARADAWADSQQLARERRHEAQARLRQQARTDAIDAELRERSLRTLRTQRDTAWGRAQRRVDPYDEEPIPFRPSVYSRVFDGLTALTTPAWLRYLRGHAQDAREDTSEAAQDARIRAGGDVPYENDDEHLCTICMSNKRAAVFLPCGHCCLCNACAQKWLHEKRSAYGGRLPPTCPMCTARVVHSLPITHRERADLVDEKIVNHIGSPAHGIPPGPIYLNAELPDPLASMHTLLHSFP